MTDARDGMISMDQPAWRARTILEHLSIDSEDSLLDLSDTDRERFYEQLIGIARARLAGLDLDNDERALLGNNDVLLVEETLEEQGDIVEAAAVYALGHDRCRGDDGMAGFGRALHRFKLGNALLLLDEDNPDNQERCLGFARRTIELLDSLVGRRQVSVGATRGLAGKLHEWCGWRCQELGRYRDAAQAFTDAALWSDDMDEKIEHTTKAAELMARDGRKQEAFSLLLAVRDELPGVTDPEIRAYWDSVFGSLEWELGGSFSRRSTTPSLPADELSSFAETLHQATKEMLHSGRTPEQLPAAGMIPLLSAELQEPDPDDLATRHRVLIDLAFVLLHSGDHRQAERRLQEAEQLEDRLGDARAGLQRRIYQVQVYRFRHDQEAAAKLLGSLLPEVRRLLQPGEQLSLLGLYLEALSAIGDRAEDLHGLAGQVAALLETELRRQPGGAARRRARLVHQRSIESAVCALLSRAETIGSDSDQGQRLLATAWQVVMAARNPELGGSNRQAPPELQAELRALEDRLHKALRSAIVLGEGSRTEWAELLQDVMEYEISGITTPRETTNHPPLNPSGVAVTFFHVKNLFSNSQLVVMAYQQGRYHVRLIPEAEHQPLLYWSDRILGRPHQTARTATPAAGRQRHMAAGGPTVEIEHETTPDLSQLLPRDLLLLPFRKPVRPHAGEGIEQSRPAPLSSEPWFLFPDGAWCALPFEMLRDHRNTETSFGQNRAVQLCLRSGVAQSSMARVDLERGWLGLGGVPGTDRINELPGSYREVTELERHLSECRLPARVLLGSDAHAANLRALLGELRPAVLHIAAHGVADQEHPEACALILAYSDSPEGELLPFRRIRELPLAGVDLVVLSACSSLIGPSDPSAGMEGLAWAFLEAGAGQVIASRYPVDDDSTGTLMLSFYYHLRELPVAEALGRARDDCVRRPQPLHEREVGAWAVWS